MEDLTPFAKVNVAVSACAAPAGGDVLVYDYTLDGNLLTTTHPRGGDLVAETFTRGAPGDSSVCSHPYCGTWLRVATYVDGTLMNNAWSVAVVRNDDYYAVAEACANYLTMDSIEGETVTQTMVSHDCPGGATPPGNVFVSEWTLSEGRERLVVVNAQYGAAVRTDFVRLADPLPVP